MFINATDTGFAPLHTDASIFSRVTRLIPHGRQVQSIPHNQDWHQVEWQGAAGYLEVHYLSRQSTASAPWAKRSGFGTTCEVSENGLPRHILNLHRDLNLFYCPFRPQLALSGRYNAHTRQVVAQFQESCGITPTGKATPETKAALYKKVRDPMMKHK